MLGCLFAFNQLSRSWYISSSVPSHRNGVLPASAFCRPKPGSAKKIRCWPFHWEALALLMELTACCKPARAHWSKAAHCWIKEPKHNEIKGGNKGLMVPNQLLSAASTAV